MRGSELLKGYGEETHSLAPPVSFIPTIALNKSQDNQQDILKNFFKQVCTKFGVCDRITIFLRFE